MLPLPSSPSSSPPLSLLYLNLSLLFISLLSPALSVSLSQTLSPTFADTYAPNLTTTTTTTAVITTTSEGRGVEEGGKTENVELKEEGRGNKTDDIEEKEERIRGNVTRNGKWREGERGEEGDKTENVELKEERRGNKTEGVEKEERTEEGNTVRNGKWREEEREGGKTENVELKEERRGNQTKLEEKEGIEGSATGNGDWREDERERDESEYEDRRGRDDENKLVDEEDRSEEDTIRNGERREEERGREESEHEERREGGEGGGGSRRETLEGKKGMRVVKHFYLWTRKNPGNSSAQLLDPTRPDTISGSVFRASKTFVIIHGFLGWGTEPWILYFKDKLLRVFPGSNVVSVDWPAGSTWWLPSYYSAVSRVPGVAQDLKLLLQSLVSSCHLNLRDLHLIGHSLGAHVAGLAAAPLKTVGRISGLDPAGLMYHSVPASQRLDSSDAAYVDVIHTNGCTTYAQWLDCYGINENLGHSDFWPNGGKHQPACSKKSNRMTNGEIGCSHEMAYVYYIESLDYNVYQTYFLARPCSSWDDYQAGQCGCGWDTQYMGFAVNTRLNGTFYLHTHDSAPYATKDPGCRPGSATAPGVRIISLALVSASALIVGTSAIVFMVRVARTRWGKRVPQGEVVAGSSGSGGGGSEDEVLVGTSDKVPILVG